MSAVVVGLWVLGGLLGGCGGKGLSRRGTGGAVASGGLSESGGGSGSDGADANPAFDAQSCEALARAAAVEFRTYLDSTSALACQADSDCKHLRLQSLNCFAACGLVIGAASTDAVTAAASGACQGYLAAGCPEIYLLCPAFSLSCQRGQCGPVWPGSVDPVPDASTARPDSAVDSVACSQPSEGAACTPEQTPCDTCCIDRWSCVGGVWKVRFIGCLPAGFACGDRYCSDGAEYCLHIPGRGGELPILESYSCERLPAPCYGRRCPTCDCLKQAGVPFQSCTSNAFGDVNVVNQPY